jgi:hypothetical protein
MSVSHDMSLIDLCISEIVGKSYRKSIQNSAPYRAYVFLFTPIISRAFGNIFLKNNHPLSFVTGLLKRIPCQIGDRATLYVSVELLMYVLKHSACRWGHVEFHVLPILYSPARCPARHIAMVSADSILKYSRVFQYP